MSWLLRFRLRSYIRNSLWPTPVAAIPLAIAAAALSRSRWTQWGLLGFAPDGARAPARGARARNAYLHRSDPLDTPLVHPARVVAILTATHRGPARTPPHQVVPGGFHILIRV